MTCALAPEEEEGLLEACVRYDRTPYRNWLLGKRLGKNSRQFKDQESWALLVGKHQWARGLLKPQGKQSLPIPTS